MKDESLVLVIVGAIILLTFILVIGVGGESEVEDEFEIVPLVVSDVSEKSVVERIGEEDIGRVVRVTEEVAGDDDDEDEEEIEEGDRVTYVVDGDTLEINTGERVRLLCIDTPEEGEYYYNEASDYLESLVLNEEVELVKSISDIDKYGRLLRFVYVGGLFVNEKMIRDGYARAYFYSSDAASCPGIQEAESEAKGEELGIWNGQESQDVSGINCDSNVYNCGDFDSHNEAQEVFEVCGGVGGVD